MEEHTASSIDSSMIGLRTIVVGRLENINVWVSEEGSWSVQIAEFDLCDKDYKIHCVAYDIPSEEAMFYLSNDYAYLGVVVMEEEDRLYLKVNLYDKLYDFQESDFN